jgi:hypothetical protein
MDPRTLIASRIDLQLRRHLDHGVDVYRAVSDARYARDMLLVCDAMQGTNLPLLARQFRQAGALMASDAQLSGRDAGPAQEWAADTSGFGVSKPLPMADHGARDAKKPWFSPSRWFET